MSNIDYIKFPQDNSTNYLIYDNIICNKNLKIEANLTTNRLFVDKLKINNNGVFLGNINIRNYNIKIKNNLTTNNIFVKYNVLKIKNNVNTNNFVLNYKNKSVVDIKENINITNNFTIDNINIIKNINIHNNNTVINNSFITNNLISTQFNHNIKTTNLIYNNELTFKTNQNVNNINIVDNLYLKENINTLNSNIHNNLNIIKQTNVKNGIITLGYKNKLDHLGEITFNSVSSCFEANCNHIIRLNDLYEKNNNSNIKLINDSININTKTTKSVIKLKKSQLEFNYKTNVNNIYFKNNTTITNDSIFVNYNTNVNKTIVYNGTIQLPFNNNKIIKGSLCYNTNTTKINVVYNDKWDILTFVDENKTGILKKNNTFYIKIFNNTNITFNNNIYIKNNTSIRNNLYIKDNINKIKNNINISNRLYINKIPIECYRNIIRTYDFKKKKWISLTLQEFQSEIYVHYKSYDFYIRSVSINNTVANTNNTYNPSDIIINKYNNFIYETIVHTVYITHIFYNILNYNNNIINIRIYKNNIEYKTISVNKNVDIIQLDSSILFNINDKLSIKLNSESTNFISNQSVLINLMGYNRKDIYFKGDTNFITDSPIKFNQNTDFNVNIDFYNNVKFNNIVSISNNNLTTLNIQKLYIKQKSYEDSLFEINKRFFIHKNGNIIIGNNNNIINNSLISIHNNNSNTVSFLNTGGMGFQSNVNILQNAYLEGLYTVANINTQYINIDSSFYNINKVLTIAGNLIGNNLFIHNGNMNMIQDNKINYININNLKLDYFNINYNKFVLENNVYVSLTNNNNLSILYNKSNSIKKSLFHHKIKEYNNGISLDDTLKIVNNSVSILSNNTDHILDINSNFTIVNNGNFYIKNNLYINNINYSYKIQSLLYDTGKLN